MQTQYWIECISDADLVPRVATVHRRRKYIRQQVLERPIKVKIQEMSQGDRINCQVTDMARLHGLGMTLFLRETGVG